MRLCPCAEVGGRRAGCVVPWRGCRRPSPSGSVSLPGCFPENPSGPRCALSRDLEHPSSRLIRAPRFSRGMFVLPCLVAVPVGGPGCRPPPRPPRGGLGGLPFWLRGVFLKISTCPWAPQNMRLKKWTVFMHLDGRPSCLGAGPQKARLNPVFQRGYGGVGPRKEGRLDLPAF